MTSQPRSCQGSSRCPWCVVVTENEAKLEIKDKGMTTYLTNWKNKIYCVQHSRQAPTAVSIGITLFLSLKVVWVVTFIFTVLLNPDLGLAASIGFSMLTVIFRTQLWGPTHLCLHRHTCLVWESVNQLKSHPAIPDHTLNKKLLRVANTLPCFVCIPDQSTPY